MNPVSPLHHSPRRAWWRSSLVFVVISLMTACTFMAAKDEQPKSEDIATSSTETAKPVVKKAPGDKAKFGDEYYRFSELMAEIFLQIENRYVDEVPPEKLFNAALSGIFMALDPHSSYMNADNFKDLEKSTEGSFSGIGIHLDVRDGILTVVSPIPGSPSAKLGVQAWDRIIQIEDHSTEGMSSSQAVKELTGPVGTKVKLVFWREKTRERIPLTIIRDKVKIQSVYSNVDDAPYVTPFFKDLLTKEKVGYIRLTKFSENVGDEISAVLDKMKAQGVQALVLDGRFNSGGLLEEGLKVSELFLNKGDVIVGTKGRTKENETVYRSKHDMKVKWPMIMLINEGSASATEILAGALKDHKRAVLVGPEGQNTFGKALVQSVMPLNVHLEKDKNGNYLPNAIRLTTARYYTPNNIGEKGQSIQGIGISPNITVKVPAAQYTELLAKGMLLGDPPLLEPGKDNDKLLAAAKAAEKKDKDSKDKDEEPDAAVEADETASTSETIRLNGGTPGANVQPDKPAENTGMAFYLKKKKVEKRPTSKDVQLQYGLDILRALQVVDSDKKS
jgi:carboxyl-terminal processing protease